VGASRDYWSSYGARSSDDLNSDGEPIGDATGVVAIFRRILGATHSMKRRARNASSKHEAVMMLATATPTVHGLSHASAGPNVPLPLISSS
jgi:hypothetical protein